MSTVKVLELHQDLNADNDAIAREIRRQNRQNHTTFINVMSSPGAGKTTLLLETLRHLCPQYRIGIMEADLDASVDAERMQKAGVVSLQVHTGGECAMNADLTARALQEFDSRNLDLIFLENVGNLVCPAENDTGADLNIEILSVPEGDDKPLKYPLMFQVCQAVLINKIDTLPWFDFDCEKAVKNIRLRNPDAEIFPLSAKTGEGVNAWISWLKNQFSPNLRQE